VRHPIAEELVRSFDVCVWSFWVGARHDHLVREWKGASARCPWWRSFRSSIVRTYLFVVIFLAAVFLVDVTPPSW